MGFDVFVCGSYVDFSAKTFRIILGLSHYPGSRSLGHTRHSLKRKGELMINLSCYFVLGDLFFRG